MMTLERCTYILRIDGCAMCAIEARPNNTIKMIERLKIKKENRRQMKEHTISVRSGIHTCTHTFERFSSTITVCTCCWTKFIHILFFYEFCVSPLFLPRSKSHFFFFFTLWVLSSLCSCNFSIVIELVYIVQLPMLVYFSFLHSKTITAKKHIAFWDVILQCTLRFFHAPSLSCIFVTIISIMMIGLSTTFNYKRISSNNNKNTM